MSEIEKENQDLKEENFLLKAELAQLKKLLFSAKRERFISQANSSQGSLFSEEDVVGQAEPEAEQLTKVKKKKKPRPIKVKRNVFPAELRRETQRIEPEGVDVDNTIVIGEDVTEILSYVPGSLFVKKIVRPRRADKEDEDKGVMQAPIPPRLIPRGMVDESLIAQIIVEKILFHTPVHRFHKKLKQAGIDFISKANLYNWFHAGAAALLPLVHLLKADLLAQAYVQIDESRIQVLSKNKPGASLRGQMWVMNNPDLAAVLFEYHASKGLSAARSVLEHYQGIVQSDGYSVYESLERKTAIQLIFCMAHARRKFIDAQNTDPPRANYFLDRVQILYNIEHQARQHNMDHAQRLQLRQDQALPIVQQLGQWLKEQYTEGQILPASPIGKAIAYALKRWQGLSAYAHDGQLEIDNNLVENCIRPLALGRKNFLFAGSDEAARNLACLYSIIGTADKHGLNVHRYITWLLRKVATEKVTPQAIEWLPHRMPEEEKQTFMDLPLPDTG